MSIELKKYYLFTALFLIVTVSSAYAQYNDTINVSAERIDSEYYKFSYKQLIIPSALMAYGTVETVLAPNYNLLNNALADEVNTRKPRRLRIDDVSLAVPALSVYALNLAGIEGKHNFKDRTIILAMASAFALGSVNVIKYTTKVERPDKSKRNSFPSGHTAIAFMGAEFLWQEYKDVSPWYGVAGYTVATATGLLRIHNNKHWFGDVAFGAGVGILSTKLAYWLYPSVEKKLFNSERKDNKIQSLALYPYYDGYQGGLGFMMGW